LEKIEKLLEIVNIARTRGNTLKEITELIKVIITHKKAELSKEEENLKNRIIDDLKKLSNWDKESLSETIVQKYVMNEKVKYQTIYKVLVGQEKWLPLADTFAALGKEKTLDLIY
jgi:lysyl-tRNA synthetase class I